MRSPGDVHVEIVVDAMVDLPTGVTNAAMASFVRHVLLAEGMTGSWQFGVRFVDDETMRQAHAAFMGVDTPTDIMTFPYEDEDDDLAAADPAAPAERGGDMMISVHRAAEHAGEAGWGTDLELFFLICHGVLHILGWDDATDEDRAGMLERQAALLSEWLDR